MAVLAEAGRISRSLSVPLCLIHADEFTSEKEARFRSALSDLKLDSDAAIRFEPGEPAEGILKVQREESIDLLVAGAMETQTVHRNFTATWPESFLDALRAIFCSIPSRKKSETPGGYPGGGAGFVRTEPSHPLCGAQSRRAQRGTPNYHSPRANHFRRGKGESSRVWQRSTLSGRDARVMGKGASSAERGAGLSSSSGEHRIHGV